MQLNGYECADFTRTVSVAAIERFSFQDFRVRARLPKFRASSDPHLQSWLLGFPKAGDRYPRRFRV